MGRGTLGLGYDLGLTGIGSSEDDAASLALSCVVRGPQPKLLARRGCPARQAIPVRIARRGGVITGSLSWVGHSDSFTILRARSMPGPCRGKRSSLYAGKALSAGGVMYDASPLPAHRACLLLSMPRCGSERPTGGRGTGCRPRCTSARDGKQHDRRAQLTNAPPARSTDKRPPRDRVGTGPGSPSGSGWMSRRCSTRGGRTRSGWTCALLASGAPSSAAGAWR
eukprot:COSAG01_NODE_2246_length_8080_cov_4.007017_8_plen_224_part_00